MKKWMFLLIIILCLTFVIVGFCKWYLPTGNYDPDSQWNDEMQIYDGNDATAGNIVIGISKTWSGFIELSYYNELHCEIIKFLAYQKGVLGIELIDIDLFYNSQWNDLYEGIFDDQVWIWVKVEPAQIVYSARIRFYAKKADTAFLYGFEFWNLGASDLATMDYAFQGQPFVDVTGKSSIDVTTMDYVFQGQPFVTRIDEVAVGWSGKFNTKTITKWNTQEITKWNTSE